MCNQELNNAVAKILQLNPGARFVSFAPYITNDIDGFDNSSVNFFYYGKLYGDNFEARLTILTPTVAQPILGQNIILLEASNVANAGYFYATWQGLLINVVTSASGYYFEGYKITMAGLV